MKLMFLCEKYNLDIENLNFSRNDWIVKATDNKMKKLSIDSHEILLLKIRKNE